MNFGMNQDKKIEIKKGINKTMIVFTCLGLIALIMIATSSLWLPDKKPIMDRNNTTEITFDSGSLKMDKDIYKDSKLNIGEIRFTVEKRIEKNVDLDIKVLFDNGTEFPKEGYKIIKSEVIPIDESKGKQYYIIQFGLPKSFYYVNVEITEKNNKTENIYLDYRNFKEKKLNEKQSNFLLNQQSDLLKKSLQEKNVSDTSDKVKGIKQTIEELKGEIQTLQAQIELITDEEGKKEKQTIINEKKKSLKEYEEKYKKANNDLTKEKETMKKINDEIKRKN